MARSRPHIPLLPVAAPPPTAGRGAIGRGAYEAIRTAVLDCTFPPGMALSEQAVSEQLAVSRAPVREAFRQLTVEGLLETVPQRGTFVARLSPDRIADAIFVRESIECRAAGLAAGAAPALRKRLATIVRQQAQASARGDYTGHLSADEAFHHAILDMAGHPHAWPMLRLARTGMNRIRHLAIPAAGSHRIALDQHRQIVAAIVEGDAAAACDAMRRHVHAPLAFLTAIQRDHPEYFEAP